MSTATKRPPLPSPVSDAEVLDALDFDATTPCAIPVHATKCGTPEAAAHWVVLIRCYRFSDTCEPVTIPVCDSGYRALVNGAAALVALSALGGVGSGECIRCGKSAKTISELVTLIGEV